MTINIKVLYTRKNLIHCQLISLFSGRCKKKPIHLRIVFIVFKYNESRENK